MKLAEKHYGRPGLAQELQAKDRNFIRPKETDLLALLEAHSLDYIFIYRSVARQHGLKYLGFPDEINLKQAKMSAFYGQVRVQVSGKTPGTFITKQGAPMVYGITIPRNAPNPRAALAFVRFVLDKDGGMAIIERCGQASAVPSVTDTYDRIPDELKRFALEGDSR
jgi:molybdate/tungstate transport system substrate-binding protein